MTTFEPHHQNPHPYPVDLTIPQFLLDTPSHPLRPSRLPGFKWLVDDTTGRSYGLEEIRERVERLARGIQARWGGEGGVLGGGGEGKVVCLFSANCIDYPITIWALHRLGLTVSCANPSYTPSELSHQLKTTNSILLFSSPSSLPTALAAAEQVGLPPSNIIVFSPPPPERTREGKGCFPPSSPPPLHPHQGQSYETTERLTHAGWALPPNYSEPRGREVGNSIAFLSFSSGTTGLPKAIMIPHRSVVANCLQMAVHEKVNWPEGTLEGEGVGRGRFARAGDVALGVLPLFHIYGLVVTLHHALFTGLTLLVVPKFNFKDVLESIVRWRVTHLYIVPPMVVMMLNSPLTKFYDLSHVRFAMVGAAPLSSEVTERFKRLIPSMRMGQGYGMTETSTTVCQFEIQKPSINGSAGTLLPHTLARIVRPDGTLAGPNEPGELWVKGPQTAVGYLNDENATRETFRSDGWVRTGDEARIDEEGNLYVLDRLKEFLKVNGFQVAPAELEGHLLSHAYVSDAGVVGIPDDLRGEVPIAFVVLSSAGKEAASAAGDRGQEIVAEEIKKWVRDQKVRYKWLDGGVVFVDAIPKNPSGKILRRILREEAKKIVEARKKGMPAMAKL